MKSYEFKTMTSLGRGWYEVDGVKARMKADEAIAFDKVRIAEAHKLNTRSGKFTGKKPVENKVETEQGTENDLGTDITEKLINHLTETNIIGKTCKMVKINCIDCGRERMIKVQDQFQVCRCTDCQRKHRNAMRKAKRAEKKALEAQA